MAAVLPPRFVDLYSAATNPGRELSVMGRATDILAPSRSRGTDWMFTFSLADHSMGGNFGAFNEGLKVRFFRKSEGDLPPVREIGDVVILRRLKMTEYQGMRMGISGYSTGWTVFPISRWRETGSATAPSPSFIKDSKDSSPSEAEMQYARELCSLATQTDSVSASAADPSSVGLHNNSFAGSTLSPPSSARPVITNSTPRRDKFSLIADVKADTYYDLTGEVVKIYPSNGVVELYISDYTSNQLLYDYEWGSGENRDNSTYDRRWPGPFGKYTLMVTLWEPHSYFAQNSVEQGDIVSLRNMYVKYSKSGKLEGVVHTDRMHPERIGITVINDTAKEKDSKVKNILMRRSEYERTSEKTVRKAEATARGQKRKAAGEGRQVAKSTARKRRRFDKLAANIKERQQFSESEETDTAINNRETSMKASRTGKKQRSEGAGHPQDLNKNIKSSHSSVLALPLRVIVDRNKTHLVSPPAGVPYLLPFQNVKTRTAVRVVDYFPKDLADFSVPVTKALGYHPLPEIEHDEESDADDATRVSTGDDLENWEWRFALMLEDAENSRSTTQRTKLKVYVAQEDADFLLKLDAVNLHADAQALGELKEKLFLLWGDLEEQKSAAFAAANHEPGSSHSQVQRELQVVPRGRPFECCLMEYGTLLSGGDIDNGNDDWPQTIESANETDGQEICNNWKRRWKLFGTTIT